MTEKKSSTVNAAPEVEPAYSISVDAARQISNTTKTRPMMESITPRWLLNFLPWVEVEAGVYRVNQVKNDLNRRRRGILNSVSIEDQEIKLNELASIELLAGLSADEIKLFSAQMQALEHPAATFINQDEEKSGFHLILSGKIEVSREDDYGNLTRLALLGPGDYLGEIKLGDKYQHDFSKKVKTLAKTRTLSISQEKLSRFLKEHSSIKNTIHETIIKNKKILQSVNAQGERVPPFMSGCVGHPDLPVSFFDFELSPREYHLTAVQTNIRIPTRVGDVYNSPYPQLMEQLRLAVSAIRERQEWELINNKSVGLLFNVANSMRIYPRKGVPTPDDMDDLISAVWKKPAFFLAHPAAIAAFGRECTRRGVPPVIVNLMGCPFMTWRGIPILPTDKLEITKDTNSRLNVGLTNIILLRAGAENQGVIGLTQSSLPPNPWMQEPGLVIGYNGIDQKGCANYLISLYFSIASLTPDAFGVLEGVQVGNYYDYD